MIILGPFSVVKGWKGFAAIKHKVVWPAGRLLNPFPAFSHPPTFCPADLFLVSSFVPQISLSGRGALKAGGKESMHNETSHHKLLILI